MDHFIIHIKTSHGIEVQENENFDAMTGEKCEICKRIFANMKKHMQLQHSDTINQSEIHPELRKFKNHPETSSEFNENVNVSPEIHPVFTSKFVENNSAEPNEDFHEQNEAFENHPELSSKFVENNSAETNEDFHEQNEAFENHPELSNKFDENHSAEMNEDFDEQNEYYLDENEIKAEPYEEYELENEESNHSMKINQTIPTERFLNAYNKMQNGPKLYGCEQCGKTFTNRRNQIDHTNVVHEGLKLHHCKICDVSFGYQNMLSKHLKTDHSTCISKTE